MINVIPILAFKDNYIWLLRNDSAKECVVVDPGDAEPVLDYLKKNDLILKDILITHHHPDHTGGIKALREQISGLTVYAPANDPVATTDVALSEKSTFHLDSIDADFTVLDIPGHTKGHIALITDGMVFTGDTLFSAGCGRVFEGTPAEMYASLQKISRLPLDTAIYCGHEYAQANLKFAAAVEPNNLDIQQKQKEVDALRSQGKPTLPSTLNNEKKFNPFLRCDVPDVIKAAQEKSAQSKSDPVFVFQTIRAWKDSF